ncbi:MAG: HAD hydrolase-like protein [Candidatus Levybacteria bacterium]|nr:HAD hydrolase-like protein [Candidatus Levybacteria bacterium]
MVKNTWRRRKMQSKFQAVIFDIDHTLLDTEQFIFQAYVHTLKTYNLPAITEADLKLFMGRSLETTYEEIAPQLNTVELSETHRVFQAKNLHLAIPFPNTLHTLQKIKEHKLKVAAVTTRSIRNSEETLSVTGIMPFIDTVISKEHVSPQELKPHPRPILLALENLKTAPSSAITIGDTIYDIEAGRRAGTKTIGVTYGSSGKHISEAKPDFIVDDIADILSIVLT